VISFRHHLLTLVAVFLALAVGLVLGGGPLSQVAESSSGQETEAGTQPQGDARGDYADGFAGAVGPDLYADSLSQRRVVLVTFPGADDEVVDDLTSRVEEADGAITGRYAFTDAMVQAEQKSLVDTLGSQLMTQGREDEVAEGATTYDRLGELFGDAVATRDAEGGTDVDSGASGVVDGMIGAELVTTHNELEARAPLVLAVLGQEQTGEGSDAILEGLVTGLSRAARGVVVAGTTADGDGGQLAQLRDSGAGGEVTTVDGIDTAAGRVATVLALARAMDESVGSFGASGSDGPVPLG
jgi:hypothetical protein